jgi:GNAT superfamily N-acetyltransferase
MGEIAVGVLEEDSWQDHRDVRLAALRESPEAFLATYAEEAMQPEQYWRHCMVRADRLLAESNGAPLGVASVDLDEEAADSASVSDLWVTPEARNTGVASRLVQAAADQAIQRGFTKPVLVGQHRKRARDRVRQQRRLPGDVAASNRPY